MLIKILTIKWRKAEGRVRGLVPWLLRSDLSSIDIDRVVTKVLMQHYPRLCGPMGPTGSPSISKSLK